MEGRGILWKKQGTNNGAKSGQNSAVISKTKNGKAKWNEPHAMPNAAHAK
jgi:hypothetical protein